MCLMKVLQSNRWTELLPNTGEVYTRFRWAFELSSGEACNILVTRDSTYILCMVACLVTSHFKLALNQTGLTDVGSQLGLYHYK